MRLRIGVVGGGLVAQAMHLHFLAHMNDRFELAAVADPSPTVLKALQQSSTPLSSAHRRRPMRR